VTRTVDPHHHDAPGSSVDGLAERLREARRECRTIDAAESGPDLTLAQAYSVQDELTALYVSAGRAIAGYKLGYTSVAMRQQMGVNAPNFGPLYDDMLIPSGSTVDGYMQPRLEPEVAVVMGRDLSGGGLLLHEVAQCVSDVRACLEIVDSVWRDYRFSVEQNTADGSSAAGVVMGPSLSVAAIDCHQVRVSLDVDTRTVATATGTAASGHPLNGVIWLCDQLAERGAGLRAGQVIITGGLTSAVPLVRGSRVDAVYDRGVMVSVQRAA
jgi:2-keto-4-pentenoate hydratase